MDSLNWYAFNTESESLLVSQVLINSKARSRIARCIVFDRISNKKKIVSEHDQEIPQSQTADNPKAPGMTLGFWF